MEWEKVNRLLLAKEVKKLRLVGKRWTQEKLALEAKVHVATVKRIEGMNSETHRKPRLLPVVLEVLGTNVEEVGKVCLKSESDSQRQEVRAKEQPARTDVLDEEQEIINALQKILLYELELYKNPDEFDETELSRYWIPIENSGKAIKKVVKAVNRLKRYGLHYGSESCYEKLTFNSVKIPSNKYADIQTTETWYFPVYDSQGERTAMPPRYENLNYTYTLRKLNGKWLLYSTTAEYYDDKFTEYPLKEKATD